MKIAICVSGETRTFNRCFDYNVYWLAHELRELHHEVDILGHTWDYCEQPYNKDQIKKLSVTSKQELEDWIKQDYFSRIVQYNQFNFYTDVPSLTECSDSEFNKTVIDTSVAAWSQVWSAFKSFSLIDDVEDYDYVIKWRWDAQFIDVHVPQGSQSLVNYFEKILQYELTHPSANTLNGKRPDILFSGNSFVNININQQIAQVSGINCLEDVVFVIPLRTNILSRDIISQDKWENKIDSKVKLKRVDGRNCSHTLWNDVFHAWDLLGYFIIPGCSTLYREL